MTDPFHDARQQVRGDAMLRRAESEIMGGDFADDDDFRRLAELLLAWKDQKDALVVATRVRDDHDGDHHELFGIADRELREHLRAIVARWDDRKDEQ